MNKKQEEVCFHYFIGKALSKWAELEWQLMHMTSSESELDFPLYVAFYSIDSFTTRLRFVDNQLRLRPAHFVKIKNDWEALKKKLERSLYKSRNKLAHWQADSDLKKRPGKRFSLKQRNVKIDSTKSQTVNLYVCDIANIYMDFRGAYLKMYSLRKKMNGHKLKEEVDWDLIPRYTLEKVLLEVFDTKSPLSPM